MATGTGITWQRAGQAKLTVGMALLLTVGLLAGARPAFAVEGESGTAAADVLVAIGAGVTVGDTLHVDITVQNAGPGLADDVTLLVSGDLLFAAVTGMPEGLECTAPSAVSCPLGDLASGQGLTLTIQGRIVCFASITASVAAASTADPVPGNNMGSAEFGPGCTEYVPPEDPCLDEYGNWICYECAQGAVDAGDDQVVTEGDLVTLNGAWDENISGHSWWQAGGPEAGLIDAGAAAPTFIAPEVGADTALTFGLFGDGCLPVEDYVVVTVLDSPAIVVCPRPQGFWKTTLDSWPVETLVLGSQVFNAADLRALLETPVRKDARLILAVQIIAAQLSLASGAPDAGTPDGLASEVVDAASALLGRAGGTLFARSGAVSTSSTDGRLMTRLATLLEVYAKGLLTEGCSA